uniref:DeoR/GlpR family DNA-binding transcription regulator n=1 Tax=Faecalibacillus intestinalis TaxID=1982626 RepID=UPI003FD8155D
MIVRLTQKKIIAKKAVELIEENTVIFLGISTVNLELAKCIYQKNIPLTIVTNMIDIMQLFKQGDHHVNLIFIGGHFNRAKDGFIGALTIEQIHNYRFDLAFIGTVGMNIHDDKVTTYDVEDGLTKKEVMDASKKCYLVAENEKFNLDGNYVFGHLSEFTGYIGEQELGSPFKEKIMEYGLEII